MNRRLIPLALLVALAGPALVLLAISAPAAAQMRAAAEPERVWTSYFQRYEDYLKGTCAASCDCSALNRPGVSSCSGGVVTYVDTSLARSNYKRAVNSAAYARFRVRGAFSIVTSDRTVYDNAWKVNRNSGLYSVWFAPSGTSTGGTSTGGTSTGGTSTGGGGSTGSGYSLRDRPEGTPTRVAGFRVETEEPFCAMLDASWVYPEVDVPMAGDSEPVSQPLTLTLTTEQDFDLCVWQYDEHWQGNAAYGSCRGAGGAFPLHNPDREAVPEDDAPHETLVLPAGVPDMETYMACIVPPADLDGPAKWNYRVRPRGAEEGGE